ncbi:RluA family pseudouridine synthase [Bdellovibrio sp. KM01]|uniref:RluA family pseudouridine synthase n=1 Tax=Bdellovibrio sp. KM01 TaxID=2748865 RepID=UPI0015E97CFF|nr:RNA pseudouridine synthase [Bdellovibrio sp. KM01]QLY26361.1 RNA pseudouridine synthase [Bdellovibrio sp. KM01]
MPAPKKIPKKYQPKGFEILHEDLDIIVGNKSPGILTVAAKWERENTVHGLLNQWVRKGNPRSTKVVHVVHRLDQATSGVLVFAKTEEVMNYLKDNWKSFSKTYYAIVHGKLEKKTGIIQSYLSEDEDYVVHSSQDSEKGKLAITEYTVLKETDKFSLLKINLLTGKKNQIRVHLSGEGHPIVGDTKYGKPNSPFKNLFLHSAALEINHPHNKKRMQFKARVPAYFKTLIDFEY